MPKNTKLIVQNIEIGLLSINSEDYICLTDMVKAKDGDFFVSDWLRNVNTLEYLHAWEGMYNPDFNYGEFAAIRNQSGINSFKVSVKEWVAKTNAIGIVAKAGRYGGTYAHKDIAFNFGMWISPVFQLYIVKEHQRLKEVESNEYNLEWNVKRVLCKANYKIHTDAIKNYIIPHTGYTKAKEWLLYADEADLLNIAMWGCTARDWKQANPQRVLQGENIRDMASINDLAILSNIESLNSILISQRLSKAERLRFLANTVKQQRKSLEGIDLIKGIKKLSYSTFLDAKKLTLKKTVISFLKMTTDNIDVLTRGKRAFIGEEFDLKKWEDVEPFFENLKTREINSAEDLQQWFLDRSEIESYLSENFAWRYIRQTCDTANTSLINALQFFITEIQPKLAEYGNALDKKVVDSPYLSELTEPGFAITLRGMKKAIEIFRDENIPLITEMQTEERRYGAIAGAMTVTLDGEEMTLQKAADRLQSTDRNIREEAWRAISGRRYDDHEQLDELLGKLVTLRDQVGKNAGFANYRDYMFAAMGRFDYTPQDCFNFHGSVKKAVVPMLDEMAASRKAALNVDELRPWDTKVDPQGLAPLKPFSTGEELLNKTIRCFSRLDPFLGDCLTTMKTMKHLDLESRKGKAPGGYNYPLDEIGVPFIFMNATSNLRDMVTLLHEGGHAVHSLVTRNLKLNSFKHTPSEVAELASMSMELITMDYWDEFFENENDLKRAKIQHLESILETLPWVATVDKFQHWMYENPQHSAAERTEAWVRIYEEFTDKVMDWSGLEIYKKYLWQRQLHIYEVPFYYIEYGIAQLGAIGVWKNYRQDPAKGLKGFLDALKLGYTATIGEIYQAANIPFDFSEQHITDLMQFVRNELAQLKK